MEVGRLKMEKKEIFSVFYESPLGLLEILGGSRGIVSVGFVRSGRGPRTHDEGIPPGVVRDCRKQLEEYFRGRRRNFSLLLDLQGTPFQKKVWGALIRIPYGKTVSYREIAAAVGNEKSSRAVGGANHRNPVAIIVPCHRVIGSDGRLTGYGGGLWRKKWLLDLERKSIPIL